MKIIENNYTEFAAEGEIGKRSMKKREAIAQSVY
jgi:hypothetical protein